MDQLRTMSGPAGKTGMLGTILLDGAFVSSAALWVALERQRNTGAQLGAVLVGMGVLDEADLETILSVQNDLSSPEEAIEAAAGMRELLGELLIRVRRLKPESLGEALEEQEQTGEKLGTILVRRGLITAAELTTVLGFQRRQGAAPNERSALRLGEILVRNRTISRERIAEALRRQQFSRRKIGEVLVEGGYLKPEQLVRGLRLQQKLLTAALAAALSFASVLPARAFDLPPSRTGARMQIASETVCTARTEGGAFCTFPGVTASAADITRGGAALPDELPTDLARPSLQAVTEADTR